MSIWNRLGLPNLQDIVLLRQELAALKAENLALHAATIEHVTEQGATSEQKIVDCMNSQISTSQSDLMALHATTIAHITKQETVTQTAITNHIDNHTAILQSNLMTLHAQSSAEEKALHAATVAHITEQETVTQTKITNHIDNHTAILQSDLMALHSQSLAEIKQSIVLLQALDAQGRSFNEQLEALNQTNNKIEKALTELRETQHYILQPQVTQLMSLLELSNQTSEGIARTQTALDDLAPMKEYLYSLWEAMKLVWINDLIDLEK